ncbi:MAG: acyl-CoA dehydrogenase, partial [Ilumatobacteraceae bacterium]
FGGGEFPWLVATAIAEMMASANAGFSLCPTLTQSAIDLLLAHGSEHQKNTYVAKMVTGEWTGTMNLTEPDAGSDLGAVRTKAVPDADGAWRITGQKAFITYGEHDLTENIIHLVLARVPDAPAGTRGISCFIVPKVLITADGHLGERNNVTCASLEHKLGIHASPTCVLEFDAAEGYLIGEPNQGMRYMFTMMNNARLLVGVQGVAIAERAYQQAVSYAIERQQGRGPGAAPGVSSPIIEHPDVRRMLMIQKATLEAMRSLAYLVAESMDLAAHHPDQTVRDGRHELVEILTPVTKAWCTDMGVELTSLALQVQGGAGYIEETGAAQYYRDARITPIYEGTNGIQAIDLVMRKLSMRDGAAVADFITELAALDSQLELAGPELASIRAELGSAIVALRTATEFLRGAESTDRLAGAAPYLRMFGIVAGGWLMARQALAATQRLATRTTETDFVEAKLVTARFYCEQVLPQAAGLLSATTARAGDLLALTAAQF